MRLSVSLHKNILETNAGNIVNKFKIRKRRDTLFFEDILADYIRACETKGYKEEMKSIAQKWMYCVISQTMPSHIKNIIPPVFVINTIMHSVWINLGLIEDIKTTKKGDIIEIKTVNECITRIIGKNLFAAGSYMGLLNALYNSDIEYISTTKEEKTSTYRFRLKNNPHHHDFKEKSIYYNLNNYKRKCGFTLKNSLEKNIFRLKEGNRLYYKDKSIIPEEQTVFHIIGNYNVLLEKVPDISFDYFRKITDIDTEPQKKLMHIKTILEVMGWGEISFEYAKSNIVMHIKNPPYGFQKEKDNWEFLIRTIQGYLWLIDKNLKIKDIKTSHKYLRVNYSK